MANDAQIVVGIKSDTRGGRVVKRTLDDIGQSGERVERGQQRLQNELRQTSNATHMLRNAMLSLGAAFSVRELVRVADTYTNIQNRLKLVTQSTDELKNVTQELFNISNETRGSYESIAEVYTRTAQATKELGITQQETLDFTRSLSQAVALSGASATEASAALTQLSQGLAAGALRGEELNSVMEQLPPVADVIAKQLGVTRGELREMGSQGLITADIIIDAFASASEELEQNFAKTVPTVGQSITVLKNNFTEFVGELDATTGASSKLAGLLLTLADNVDLLAKAVGVATAAWLAYRSAALFATGASVLAGIAANVMAFTQLALTVRSAAQASALLQATFMGTAGLVAALGAVVGAAYIFRTELKATITDTLAEIIILADRAASAINRFFGGRGGNLTGLSADDIRTAADDIILGLSEGQNKQPTNVFNTAPAPQPPKPPKGKSPTQTEAEREKMFSDLIKDTTTETEKLMKRLNELQNLQAFAQTEQEVQAVDRAVHDVNMKLKKTNEETPDLADNVRKISLETDRFANSASNAFTGFINGSLSARDALSNLANDLLNMASRKLITQPISSGISGILGSVINGVSGSGLGASIGGLFGFNSGGSMVLGGDAGIDQNLLSLNNRPIAKVGRGETLSISPKQKSGGNGATINQTINVSTGVQETIRAEMMMLLPEIQRSTRAAVRDANARGFDR